MAISQQALQPSADNLNFDASLSIIELEHVSVSQLLGRDYIFINVQDATLPINNPALLHSMLDDLIDELDLVEAHAVAISVRESSSGSPSFTRHDLTWHKHKISRVESTDVTHPEQHEFMDMIWRCSTSALPA